MREQRLRILVLVQNSTSGRWTELALKPGRRELTIEYGQGDDVRLAGLNHAEYCYFCLGLLDCSLWGKIAVMSYRHSNSPVERLLSSQK